MRCLTECQNGSIHLPKAAIQLGSDKVSEQVDDVPYRPPAAGIPLETFTLSSLVQRHGRAQLANLQRPHFELLVCCSAGTGRHEVDFGEVELGPNRILHVRPGQVHRWILEPLYEANLVLLQPLESRRNWKPGPHIISTDRELNQDVSDILGFASRNDRSTPLSIRSLEAIRDLLVARLGLDDSHSDGATPHEGIYDDFERLLAQADPPLRTVDSCARLLGCSARTLTRACQGVAGVAPKRLIDRAIALEAQRQLSVGNSSATQVAEALGFAELSHFSRFFVRVTNETPSAFAASFAT